MTREIIGRTPRLAVSRDGKEVTIEIRCVDLAAAKALYEEACFGARSGRVVLEVNTVPRETIDVFKPLPDEEAALLRRALDP